MKMMTKENKMLNTKIRFSKMKIFQRKQFGKLRVSNDKKKQTNYDICMYVHTYVCIYF